MVDTIKDAVEEKIFRTMAPNVATFMDRLEKVKTDPATDPKLKAGLESLQESFKGHARKNGDSISALEHAMKTDPKFSEKLWDGIVKDPKAVERILPEAMSKPLQLKEITLAGLAAAQAPKPQPAAVVAERPNDPASYPGKGRPDAYAPVAAAAAATAAVPSTAAPDPALVERIRLDGMIRDMGARPDFQKLMGTVEAASPEASNVLSQHLNDGTSDPAKRKMLIEGLHQRAAKDPEYFSKIDDAVNTNKGMASTAIRSLIDDPARGFAELDQKMEMGKSFSFFKNMFGPGGMDNIFAQLKQMLGPILEMVTGLFRGSSRFALDNPNSRVARDALAAVNSPAVLEDVKTGETLPTKTAEADRGMDRQRSLQDEETRRRQGAGPGVAPGMDPQGA